MGRSAVVIGGGLGGLASAIRLQHAGWNVTILEKNPRLGGRCNVIETDGFTFDTGPTLLLMRDVLDDLFRSVGRDLRDYVQLVRVHPNYRVTFGDGSSLEVTTDRERMAEGLEAIEPGASRAFRRYIEDAGYKYRVSRAHFVERNFNHWYEFTTAANLYYLLTTNTLRKLDRHAARYFNDPRLIAALTFQTMYLGLAPADAPAVYSLLPYTELEEGIWYPCGGMYSIVTALERLARELGVSVRTESPVVSLELDGRGVSGVRVESGEVVTADAVLSNADLPYTYDTLVPRSRRGRFTDRALRHLDYGSSAYLLYLGVDRTYPDLLHHNVFLSSNTRDNFDSIFKSRTLPGDPSLYVNVPTRTDPRVAPPAHDVVYVLVPVPRLAPSVDWTRDGPAFREAVYRRLESNGLPDLRRHVVVEREFTPVDFASEYNLAYGSAFGLSHNFKQVGYMRPANKAREIGNLYFVGASTVPGGGIPMVVIGSKLVTERMQKDWGRA
ncbi:MAG TPA: phytoene desaturase family protein [Chloroflexota bacterium]